MIDQAFLEALKTEMPQLDWQTDVPMSRCTTLLVAPLDESSADLIEFDGEVEGRLPLEISFTGHTINVLKGSR